MNEKKYYAVPYISNSTLTWFQISPKYCWLKMNREIADVETTYSQLGTQIHLYVLEPEEFNRCYTYLDFKVPISKQQLSFCEAYVKYTQTESALDFEEGTLSHEASLVYAYDDNYSTERLTPAAKLKVAEKIYEQNSDYIKYLQIRGDFREVLSKSKQELLTTITQSLRAHKKANGLMFDDDSVFCKKEYFNELPVYWEFPIEYNGETIKCKSLIDRLIVDHLNKKVTIVDLKTTAVIGDLTATIDERNYNRQLTFYKLAVRSMPNIPNDYEIEAYIVAVNTSNPFECRVYRLTDETFHQELLTITKLMQDISWHWFTNNWEYSRAYYDGDGTEN